MDADGNVLAKGGRRTVAGFDDMMTKAAKTQTEFVTLGKKAKAGDQKARIALFEKHVELGHYDLKEAKAELEKIGKIEDEAVAKRLEGQLTGVEVNEIMSSVKSRADIPKAVEKFVKMWKQGRVPAGNGNTALQFLASVVNHSIQKKDKTAATAAMAEFEKRFGKDRRYQRFIEQQKQRIDKLDG